MIHKLEVHGNSTDLNRFIQDGKKVKEAIHIITCNGEMLINTLIRTGSICTLMYILPKIDINEEYENMEMGILETAVDMAVNYRNFNVFKLFIDAGANINLDSLKNLKKYKKYAIVSVLDAFVIPDIAKIIYDFTYF